MAVFLSCISLSQLFPASSAMTPIPTPAAIAARIGKTNWIQKLESFNKGLFPSWESIRCVIKKVVYHNGF